MKENFPYRTSENEEIDKLTRHTQLNVTQVCDYMEWIPFEKFEMVKYIGWIWDDGAQEWTRAGPMNVALKRLDNSQNISSSYINQPVRNIRNFIDRYFYEPSNIDQY
ncbi:hypothetical protein RhiirA5_420233 [Rhizophagus irregularis]|uniref:Uncharacterized protein n=1 Tax=Rhizophagus irregularis TaxID=588596 RepID=A0A2N0PGL2_9GLOM|nr:hypothetical protein RhiirA5_420233 [Rhizophagus irregularis]